eukprot:359188-Chlamydomonas_euryale.AAC.19
MVAPFPSPESPALHHVHDAQVLHGFGHPQGHSGRGPPRLGLQGLAAGEQQVRHKGRMGRGARSAGSSKRMRAHARPVLT